MSTRLWPVLNMRVQESLIGESIWETKGNPWVDFLMVIMASGIACGRVRTTTTATTTVESRKMAAILQIIGWQRHTTLVYCVLLWYWTSMLWLIDTCQNKVSADQYHVTISRAQVYSSSRSSVFWSWPLTKCWFFRLDRGLMSGLLVENRAELFGKPANAHSGLTVNQITTFSSMQMFLLLFLCIWWLLKLKTEGQTIYRKPQRKVTKLKSKFYFFWVSLIGLLTTRSRSYAFRLA